MKNRDEILGLMLPDEGENYLLPNVCVAEIFTLNLNDFESSTDLNHQSIGMLHWRLNKIHLYHMQKFILGTNYTLDLKKFTKLRVAVINPITKPDLPLYGILTTNTPKLTRLQSHNIRQVHEEIENEAIAFIGELGSDFIKIPNLIHLETLIRSI